MRWLLVALAIAAAVFAVAGTAESNDSSGTDGYCKGLTCAGPGDEFYVPEAAHVDGSVSSPAGLERQDEAGFYEYSPSNASNQRSVAYVIPPGELSTTPESIRELPIVAANTTSDFAKSTVVVYEAGALVVILDPDLLSSEQLRAMGRPSKGGKKANGESKVFRSASECNDHEFCLFRCEDQFSAGGGCYGVLHLSGDTLPPSAGWKNLAQWNFGNDAESMVNNRDKDNKLAKLIDGGGAHYCADSHSEDNSFANNNPGNNEASSVRASDNDNQC